MDRRTPPCRAHLPRHKHRVLPPRSLPPVIAVQVAGGTGCCACLSLLGPCRRAAAEDGNKTVLGGSGVAVTKLGTGSWSWGETTYWNNFHSDDKELKTAKGALWHFRSIGAGVRTDIILAVLTFGEKGLMFYCPFSR